MIDEHAILHAKFSEFEKNVLKLRKMMYLKMAVNELELKESTNYVFNSTNSTLSVFGTVGTYNNEKVKDLIFFEIPSIFELCAESINSLIINICLSFAFTEGLNFNP